RQRSAAPRSPWARRPSCNRPPRPARSLSQALMSRPRTLRRQPAILLFLTYESLPFLVAVLRTTGLAAASRRGSYMAQRRAPKHAMKMGCLAAARHEHGMDRKRAFRRWSGGSLELPTHSSSEATHENLSTSCDRDALAR